MKSLILILLVSCLGLTKVPSNMKNASQKARRDLSLDEAQKILGQSAKVQENKDSTAAGGYFRKTIVYQALASDPRTNKEINLFYMFENFPDASAPGKLYTSWERSNQAFQGFETLNNLGDEAFLHSDKTNFATLIIRKGNKLIRLKINKLSSRSSFAELKKIAADVVGRV